MSVQPVEKEFVELPHLGDSAFGALLDALVPAEAGATGADAGDPAGQAAAPPAGSAASPAVGGDAPAGGQPDAAGQAPAGQPAGTGAGEQPAPGAPAGDPAGTAAPGAVGDLPGTGTVDAETIAPKLGELSTALETNLNKAFQQQAYDAAREEYGQYFEALEKHPRLLVGTEVPKIGGEGTERLKDSADAKEWQEAVKAILVAEIREGATTKMEESADFLQTVHASIDLFKNNPDLIPGTKGFNKTLADNFAGMMEPYEVRVEGKLQGYSIPVQPIIEKLRTQLKAAAPAPPVAGAATPAVAPVRSAAPEPPQAGIASKAGSSGDREDFSTLFGTIGLPNLQI